MAISSVTGWIDNSNGFRSFYKNKEHIGSYPMTYFDPVCKNIAMNSILKSILSREDLMDYTATDFIEIGIMMGNRLDKVPNE